MTPGQCLGPCNSGGNAKWCGPEPPPPPPPPPLPPKPQTPVWGSAKSSLTRNGKNVVLHGIGTTCTEYLLRGIGMACWAEYNWANTSDILKIDLSMVYELVDVLLPLAQDPGSSVVPAVRIPTTASSWLGLRTNASSGNMEKYPGLDRQYREFIMDLVSVFTDYSIVAIVDLHWSDDDTDNKPMAGSTAVEFWGKVSEAFEDNPYVFYELYNEPHNTDVNIWMNGSDATHTAGMLQMLAAVRKNSRTAPVIIAGAQG